MKLNVWIDIQNQVVLSFSPLILVQVYVDGEAMFNENLKQLDIEKTLRSVKKDGFCVIEGFLGGEVCKSAREQIDKALMGEIKTWLGSKSADKRIFGAENISEVAREVFLDGRIDTLLKKLYKSDKIYKTIMMNLTDAVDGNLGSGEGWHRDSGSSQQFKLIFYLNKVENSNGPFQYLLKSQKVLYRLISMLFASVGLDQQRINDIEIYKLKKLMETKSFFGGPGTLIVANTQGVHRGKPLISGKRYAMTVYTWEHPIPSHIKKYMS